MIRSLYLKKIRVMKRFSLLFLILLGVMGLSRNAPASRGDFLERLQKFREEQRRKYLPVYKAYREALPFEEKGRWGYRSKSGRVLLPPDYEEARPFLNLKEGWQLIFVRYVPKGMMIQTFPSEEYRCAPVRHEGVRKLLAIHKDGTSELIGPYGSDLIPFRDSGKGLCGYLDLSGRPVVEPRFYLAAPFSEGLALIARPRLPAVDQLEMSYLPEMEKQARIARVISKERKTVPFPSGVSYPNSYKWGYITPAGVFALPLRLYTGQPQSFREGVARIVSEDLRYYPKPSIYLMNRKGRRINSTPFVVAGDFHEGLAFIAYEDWSRLKQYANQFCEKSAFYCCCGWMMPAVGLSGRGRKIYDVRVSMVYGIIDRDGGFVFRGTFQELDAFLAREYPHLYRNRSHEFLRSYTPRRLERNFP